MSSNRTKSVSVRNIKKSLGGRAVLKDVSFDVYAGDIFGYFGPNGAGKTTTIRILLGLLEPDSGHVKFFGNGIESSETRIRVGFSLESEGLYGSMTGVENLELYGRIYEVSNVAERIKIVLEQAELSERGDDPVNTYSKGMRKRLSLARAMVHDPDVLILDEPTSGVDPTGRIEIRKILVNIARSERRTVFLSSHNLDEVQRICNRVALLDRGEIKLYGDLDEMIERMNGRGVLVKTTEVLPESLITDLRTKKEFGVKEVNGREVIFAPRNGVVNSTIIKYLVEHDVNIEEVRRKNTSLEDMYQSILEEVDPV